MNLIERELYRMAHRTAEDRIRIRMVLQNKDRREVLALLTPRTAQTIQLDLDKRKKRLLNLNLDIGMKASRRS